MILRGHRGAPGQAVAGRNRDQRRLGHHNGSDRQIVFTDRQRQYAQVDSARRNGPKRSTSGLGAGDLAAGMGPCHMIGGDHPRGRKKLSMTRPDGPYPGVGPPELVIDLGQTVAPVLADNLYLVLGTADAAGKPWVSPVFFAARDENLLYWVPALSRWKQCCW